MMKFLEEGPDTLSALCAATKRWGMAVNAYGSADPSVRTEEVRKAAPYLSEDQALRVATGGCAYLLFDSEEECYAAYDATVGDDGPTKANPYNGPVRVYALTCGPDGQTRNENT